MGYNREQLSFKTIIYYFRTKVHINAIIAFILVPLAKARPSEPLGGSNELQLYAEHMRNLH